MKKKKPLIQDNININLNNYKEYLNTLCSYGELSSLADFLNEYKNHFKYKSIYNHTMTKGFELAVFNGNLNNVEYLLTTPDFGKHADIHHNDDYAIRISCHKGHLDIVKFLLTSPLLEEKANPLAKNSEPFIWASESNQTEVMQFLLENNFNIDPHYISPITGNSAIMASCDQNAFEAVQYISTLPHFDINKALSSVNLDGKDGFQLACENHENDSSIVEYLILELGFKPNKKQLDYIKDNIEHPVVEFINNLLKSKILYNSLQKTLNSNSSQSPKLKI